MTTSILPMAVERLPLATSSSPPGVPADSLSEQALIGCILYGGSEIFLEVANEITSDVFYDPEFRLVFEIMGELANNGIEPGFVQVVAEFRTKFGRALSEPVMQSMDAMASPREWPYFRDKVVECFEKRKLMERASRALRTAQDPIKSVSEAREEIEAATVDAVADAVVIHGEKLANATEADLEKRMLQKGSTVGIPTGFRRLDKLTGGLIPGEYSVIAARPSEGKSAIGMALIYHAVFKCKVPTLFVSLEMPLTSVMGRFAAMDSGIDYSKLRHGTFSRDNIGRLQNFTTLISSSCLYVLDATALTAVEIARRIRRMAKTYGVKLVVVDYIQKIRPSNMNEQRTQQIMEISDCLKNAAKQNNVHVCGLAQVNREAAKEARPPRVHEIADSDAIERDADLILMLHRPKEKTGIRGAKTKLVVGKQREGAQGLIDLTFDASIVRFVDAP